MQLNKIAIFSLIASALIGAAFFLAPDNAKPLLPDGEAPVLAGAEEHNLYDPARTALVNASRQLALTIRQEEAIFEQRQRVRSEIDQVLRLLSEATSDDPARGAEIGRLRADVLDLGQAPRITEADGEALIERYRQLLADFEQLIERY